MPDDVSALQLLLTGDPALLAIVQLSLIVSLSAVVFGGLIGVPFGAAVALRSIRSLLASARARATIRIAFQPVSLSKNATPVAFAARPIEARDHAELDRIGGGNEDDRNRLRCRQSRQCDSGRECSDHGRQQAYALGFPLVQPAAEGPASRWGRPELVSIEASVLAAAIVKKRPLSTEGGL